MIITVLPILYLATQKQCNKQYTGETTDQFRNRWSNYRDNARNNARKFDRRESCMEEHLHKNFQTEGQKSCLNEVQLHLLIKKMEKI